MTARDSGNTWLSTTSSTVLKPPCSSAGALMDECQRCGACCASFRVSFYWAEAWSRGLPDALVEKVNPQMACMAGTNRVDPRCVALRGTVGEQVHCSAYGMRPEPCRQVELGDEKCLQARQLKGLGPPRLVARI